MSLNYGIAWSDDYKLDNKQVDRQHYKLFEMAGKLVGLCTDAGDEAQLRQMLDFLVNYTVQHFNDEEALQIKYNYPDYKRHKQLHENFKATVGDMVKKFNEGESPVELSGEINKIVVKWLINHISYEDKKIGAHIRKCEME